MAVEIASSVPETANRHRISASFSAEVAASSISGTSRGMSRRGRMEDGLNESERVTELRNLLASCAALAAEIGDEEIDEEERRELSNIRHAIENLWVPLAKLAAQVFPGSIADDEYAGYVRRQRVLIPFYLLEDVPGDKELDELTDLGLSLRISDGGTICLSGSTALLGSLRFVGDIDYCEYAPHLPGSTGDIVVRIGRHAIRSQPPLCERVKVVGRNWSRQCSGEWETGTAGSDLEQLISGGAFQLKLDFVTTTKAVGAVEATNMVLLLDPAKTDRIIMASFAAQEVPVAGSTLPRDLADPLQLGRYMNFLKLQIQDHIQDAPIKALKRALSLARILLWPEWNVVLLDLLHDNRGTLAAAFEARTDLLSRLTGQRISEPMRQSALETLGVELKATIAELEKAMEIHSKEDAASWRTFATAWFDQEVRPVLNDVVEATNDLIAGR